MRLPLAVVCCGLSAIVVGSGPSCTELAPAAVDADGDGALEALDGSDAIDGAETTSDVADTEDGDVADADAEPDVPPEVDGSDVGDATDSRDGSADDADVGPQGLPNISAVLGYPWSATSPPELNPAWQSACEDELPYGTPVTPPGLPAAPDNCAGNPAACGPGGSQDCTAAPAAGKWLHRLTLDTGAYPEAVCTDGSPGLVEVRAGSGDGANNWLIWFKGGGACRSHDSCARRWCGKQSGDSYRTSIMSSDWNGDGLVDRPHCARADAGSALDPDLAGNPFANANVVKIWYCGSDSHVGTATADYVDDDADGDGTPRDFSVQHKGHSIVEAVISTLVGGGTSDDGAVALPSLALAEQVVVAGSSAGSYGAMQNLDYIHDEIVQASPTATVRGVLDANMPPSDETWDGFGVFIDAARDEMVTPGMPLSQWRRDNDVASWDSGWHAAVGAYLDQSCVASVDDSEIYRCMSPAALMLAQDGGGPVIETDVFVRMDLGDAVIGRLYRPCQDPVTSEDCYPTPHSPLSYDDTAPSDWLTLADGSDHNRATLLQLFAAGGPVSGVFGPGCGTHTGFANANFSAQLTADYDGTSFSAQSFSFMQALTLWLTTGQPVRVIDAAFSDPDAPSAVCNGPPG